MKGKRTRHILRQWALMGMMITLAAILAPSWASGQMQTGQDLTVDNDTQNLTSDVTYDNEFIGATSQGQGVLNQTGGNNTVNRELILGQNYGSNGVYNLSGGSLTARIATIGMYGLGTFNQLAGSASINNIFLGPLGEYNLQAGVLNTGILANYGNFNLAGGALIGGFTDGGLEPAQAATEITPVGRFAITNNGIMQGYGVIGGSGGFVNNGYCAVTGPRGLFLTNSGPNVNNGTMDINNILTLAPERAAAATVAAASLALAEESVAALTNNGSMNLTKMSVVNGPGPLANSAAGTISANGGAILSRFNNEGNLVVGDGGLNIAQGFTNAGTVELRSYAPAASLAGQTIDNVGTITGHGQISSDVINEAGGVIDPDGSTLTMLGKVANRARAEMRVRAGETLRLSQGLSEANTGTINVLSNGKLAIAQSKVDNQPAPMINLGNITVLDEAKLDIAGDLTNDLDTLQELEGNITVDGGTLEVVNVLTNKGTLNVASTVKASKVKNTSTGKIVLGKAAEAAAAERLSAVAAAAPAAAGVTLVDAELSNEGHVDILSETQFAKPVTNEGAAAALAIYGKTEFADKVTNIGGKVDIEAETTFKKEVANKNLLDSEGKVVSTATLTVDAPATFVEKVTNTGTLDLKEAATFEKPVENTGTVVAQEASIEQAYDGGSGLNTFKNLNVAAPAAYLKGAAARFAVSGDLTSQSRERFNWDTNWCELAFVADPTDPAHTVHNLTVNGLDKGASADARVDNFAWDKLIIEAQQSVNLVNGAADGAPAALYVRMLEGLVFSDVMAGEELRTLAASGDSENPIIIIANIIGNGVNIYYDAAADPDLGGLTYGLTNGGLLAPAASAVPLPPSVLLLGSGLLGLGLLGRRRKHSA